MDRQTQLLQRLAESVDQRNHGANRHGPPEEDLQRKIERFIRLKAPTFSYAEDPLEADDWLRVIETKLDLTNCTDEECVALAVHQLEGTAKSWWDSYCDSHHDPAHISWEEFARAFREQHVPRQVMIQKAQEFRTMTQGTMRVEEYERHFTKMMRYAADDTNTEEKKQFWFLRGLHHGIRQIVTGCEYPSLRSLVNRAIAVERERLGWEDRQRSKKRQTDHQVRDRPFQKTRNAPPLPPRSGFRSGSSQPGRNFSGGGNHYSGNRTHGGQNQGGGNYHRQQPAQRTNSGSTPFVCFTCNKPGHKSYECPEKKTPTPARAPGSTGRPAQAPRSADRGRLTHLTEEEARDAPDVVTGPVREELTDDQDYPETQEDFEETPGSRPSTN
ncbi:uncharacterized protein LOC112879864 [Panicum hallii]|uniref:uncharacterized protein LOC112879864 n=1 Tax=Panicum hallii TaxID=206008 RepID=UPI000DF4EDF4|nr:uncharacterized protein LOC112879864 [Panicum hallii]